MHARSKGLTLIEVVIVAAISMVMAAIAVPNFRTAMNNYRINGSIRQIQALATLAHVKAAAKNTRYRVLINTAATPNSYNLQFCNDAVATRNPTAACVAWLQDTSSGRVNLAPGVSFAVPSLATAPTAPVPTRPDQAGCTASPAAPALPAPCQSTNMTFNSRGLLYSETANSPADGRCFYLAGTNTRPLAVCTVLTGRTIVYALTPGGVWTQL